MIINVVADFTVVILPVSHPACGAGIAIFDANGPRKFCPRCGRRFACSEAQPPPSPSPVRLERNSSSRSPDFSLT
jgi:hypothetical protein